MAEGLGPSRVLVVDDERAFADVLSELFEEEGYRVERAYDGEHALRILRTDPPDLVLSDVMLPRVSGIELLKEARRRYGHDRVAFLLLSAGRDPGISADHACFMPKPIDFDRLLAEVSCLLYRNQRQAATHVLSRSA